MRFGPMTAALNCLLSICLSISALALPGTRGLETFDLDQFVQVLQADDFKKVQKWFADQADRHKALNPTLSTAFTRLSTQTTEKQLARDVFQVQMQLRQNINLDSSVDLTKERTHYALFQSILEEIVIRMARKSGTNQFTFSGAQLTELEKLGAGRIRNVEVVPGDIIIQIGSDYLSSHFIAHSQSSPGLASHSLVISKAGAQPEILESLIEDGVNRRDPTTARLARFFVLSLPGLADRQKAGQSTEQFIATEKIPFVEGGLHGTASPLPYDSTMNPKKKSEGAYFCTALVQEIYLRASLNSEQIPYLENQTNWNALLGIEKLVFEQLSIGADRVPAPGDLLMQPQFQVRSLVLDAEGLKSSRRLRATVDAFFDILTSNPGLKLQLFQTFQKIPNHEIKKAEILKMMETFIAELKTVASVTAADLKKFEGAHQQMQESLPQTANLRQIVFFMILNQGLQNKSLETLKAFEEKDLKRHATPGELRSQANQFLGAEIAKMAGFLELFN